MAAQFGLVALGPAGWVACAAITILLVAGASGVFDQSEVDDSQYDDDGIYVPYIPYNPNPDPHQNPDETPYEPEITVDPDQEKEKDKDKLRYVLPFGFVSVYASSQKGADSYDPDIDDITPPSSSFTVAAEAYDSNIGYMIAAVMAGILAYWVVRMYMEER